MSPREGVLRRRVAAISLLDLLGAGLAVLLLLGFATLQEMHAKLDSPDGTTDVPYLPLAWSLATVVGVEALVSAVCRVRSGSDRPRIVRVLDTGRWALVAAGFLCIAVGSASLAAV